MSDAAKRIVRDWLARVEAGRIEPEDFGLTEADVIALTQEVAPGA